MAQKSDVKILNFTEIYTNLSFKSTDILARSFAEHWLLVNDALFAWI